MPDDTCGYAKCDDAAVVQRETKVEGSPKRGYCERHDPLGDTKVKAYYEQKRREHDRSHMGP